MWLSGSRLERVRMFQVERTHVPAEVSDRRKHPDNARATHLEILPPEKDVGGNDPGAGREGPGRQVRGECLHPVW